MSLVCVHRRPLIKWEKVQSNIYLTFVKTREMHDKYSHMYNAHLVSEVYYEKI